MSYDDDWPDNTMEDRRAMVRKTIRPATASELKQLGEKLFPVVTDPWAERFNAFLNEHANDKFHLAEVPGARIAYCRAANSGIWFIPGSGMGIIQPKGLQALAEIVDAL
ncbi:MAG TPA: hypothetical protein VLO11_07065 [Luteolibacter sp.]|nr:hypothetical protein [Luteolibacter sp.]